MIDLENIIFTKAATKLREAYPGIYVSGELELNPAKFPCVFIEEADNYVLEKTSDNATIENHAVLMYEVNVFSTKTVGRKSEAKKIFSTVNDVFEEMGFTRQTIQPLNADHATKYRIAGRFIAVADHNGVIYRR